MDERARGRIIRVNPYSDTSLIVSWLTEEHGSISTLARGARGRKSPFAGRLDLFYQADISFHRSKRTLHLLKEVSLKDPAEWLRKDLAQLSQASYIANLIAMTIESDTPVPEICQLFESCFAALQKPAPLPVMLLMEMRYLDLQGVGPNYEDVQPGTGKLISLLRSKAWDDLSMIRCSRDQIDEIARVLGKTLVMEYDRTARGREETLKLLGL